jgi:peptide subunit release factor RF-3
MVEIEEPREELKRADHLIFVTLKYTRTCDVIKNTIHRLINAYDLAIIRALEILKEKKKIESIPLTPISRAENFKSLHRRNKDIMKFMAFYFLLKRIDRAEYTKRGEFRKNVCLTVMDKEDLIEVDIPMLHEYFERTRSFVLLLESKFK